MVKKIKLFLIVFFLLLFANLINAAPFVEINVSSTFERGETVKFFYTFVPDKTEKIEYLPSISCMGSPEVMLSPRKENLTKNWNFSGDYIYGVVDNNLKAGICTASISLLEPYNLIFTKSFEIINFPEISFNPTICKIEDCKVKTRVFNQKEKIYLNYISSIENISVSSRLIFPDLSIKELVLPTEINADMPGTYIWEINTTKEGYDSTNKKEEFAVIAQDIEINYITVKKQRSITDLLSGYTIHIAIIIFISIILIILVKRLKPRKRNAPYFN